MISSLIIALKREDTLKEGVAKQRAVDTIPAVKGPQTPIVVTNSAKFGVRRNGTGQLPSNSPTNERINQLI